VNLYREGARVVKVVGTTFQPKEEIDAAMLIPNPKITLLPDHENPTDPGAVRLHVGSSLGGVGHESPKRQLLYSWSASPHPENGYLPKA
jgi:hypothetical protein